jgi:hypothetical protein
MKGFGWSTVHHSMPSRYRKINYNSRMGYKKFLLKVAKYQPPTSNGNLKMKMN